MGEDRFSWDEEEVNLQLSQCSDCNSNEGIVECKVFKNKPNKYSLNEEECPKYKKE